LPEHPGGGSDARKPDGQPPRRYIPHSPLEGVVIVPGKARKRILKPTQLKKVWDAATVEASDELFDASYTHHQRYF
jgi:hypothetical protein